MPYIKQKTDPMTELLYSKRMDGPKLAKALGCSPPTALKKLRNPECLTIGDLRKINRCIHIPIEKIREAI